MKLYLFLFILIFELSGLFSSYADEICPENKEILEYDSKVKALHENLDMKNLKESPDFNAIDENFNKVNELHEHMGMVFNRLSFECAEKLVGQGVDNELFMAGFPDLITLIAPDRIVDALENVFLYGDHSYFIKNNERIIDYLQREKNKKWFFVRIFQNMDTWHKVHDFALAAKFSLDEETDLEEMKTQAKRAYNRLDFALYLPIWQGEERREQFTQLCQEIGCKLDTLQECSPTKKEDLWTAKATYIANLGDMVKVGKQCTVSANNNGKFQELLPLPDGDPLNYTFNFRKIGILNSNCHISIHRYYLEQGDFASADNCGQVSAKMNEE